jgi:TrmH family RNA methyltransferase
MKKRITSVENAKIKAWSKLKIKKYRDEYEQFIVEGFHLVNEAKKHNLIIEIISTKEENEGL